MTAATRSRWAAAFTASATAHWTAERTAQLAHGKQLAVLPAEAPLLLRALGLLHRDATMPPAQVRKFLQVNHVVRLVAPALAALRARHPVIRIVDAGCGRSYLSLVLAWVARERWNHRVEVLGIDRDPAVLAECARRAEIAGLDDVAQFRAALLEDVAIDGRGLPPGGSAAEGRRGLIDDGAHAVLGLHACDTATDDAIALGVRLGAELIAVAPCCQAELARGWSAAATAGPFAPIHSAPHLRRELAAHVTDAMRMLLLRAAGYAVTPMEFIAATHTKKNTLIRAIRAAPDPTARAAYDALVAATGGHGLALATRLSF